MSKIQFCNKCGNILTIKKEFDFFVGSCSCGAVKLITSEMDFSEKGKEDKIAKGVLENKEDTEGFPNVCKKCGHTQSNVHDLGSPYSDESNVYLFKCKKCGYVERQADGSGNG